MKQLADAGYGSAKEFNQSIAIAAAGWGSKHVGNRGGALTTGKGLSEGVCAGLVALYIANRADYDAFLSKFVSPVGMAQVRGLMNLQAEAGRTGAHGANASKSYRQMMAAFVKAFGGPDYSGKFANKQNGNGAKGASDMASKKPGIYDLGIYGTFGGHAIAIANTGSGIKIFDPNFGEITMPVQGNVFPALNWLLSSNYGTLTGWDMMRYEN